MRRVNPRQVLPRFAVLRVLFKLLNQQRSGRRRVFGGRLESGRIFQQTEPLFVVPQFEAVRLALFGEHFRGAQMSNALAGQIGLLCLRKQADDSLQRLARRIRVLAVFQMPIGQAIQCQGQIGRRLVWLA